MKQLTIAALVLGTCGFAFTPCLAQPISAIEVRTSSNASLGAPGTWTTILTTTVPAGEWLAVAKLTVINWGAKDYFRCRLQRGTQPVDGGTVMIGEASGMPAAATVVTNAKLSLSAATTVSVACSHDGPITQGFKIDPGANLILSPISGQKGDKGEKGDKGDPGTPGGLKGDKGDIGRV